MNKYKGLAMIKKAILHFCLIIGALASLFPFYWLVVMSTRTTSDVYRFPPVLIPGNKFIENFQRVLENINFWGSFLNSVYVSVVTTLGVVFFCSLAGFFFAKFDFPGKTGLFMGLLATMMIPGQLGVIPRFIMMQKFGWVNSFNALIVPSLASAFGIFWMKQYGEETIPDELISAATIDGCGEFGLYWHVGLPLLRPALAFLGIFTFMGAWNDYMWPLIVISDPNKSVIQVALSQLNGIYNTDMAMVMAATVMAVLPLVVLFIVFSRQFISDIAAGAIKG
ncbi:carbohydrate ABC transporter permease [Caldanaerobius polysaccharolyticus]|uniref:carbohydrate ABC transporter permease n=1 Tax=Caldanaerobius polysaccharolyticus TaxID=44256 RepID=UPI000ABF93A2|nr:carbohydrate ABC transporter permease [Caldanaerobius polysaccharolyticus]